MQRIQLRPSTLEDDAISAEHLIKIARELGCPEDAIDSNFLRNTSDWLTHARQYDRYQGFIAEVDHQIVGSIGCQLFQKGYPQVVKCSVLQYGYIWGLYIEPAYRRQGIATQLMQCAIDYLTSLHCTQILLHASPTGQLVYERLGFIASNEMSLKVI